MINKNIFLIISLLAVSAYAQNEKFDSLSSMSISQIREIPSDFSNLPNKSWGVSYTLKGAIQQNNGTFFLNTDDGRIFKLDIDKKKAQKFLEKSVIVEAQAKDADALDLLKVTDIKEYTPSENEITLPEYQPRRRQALLIKNKSEEIIMGNVRTLKEAVPSENEFHWTTMKIKPELVKNVYFIKKPFKPEMIAAHSFLIFTFEPGGLLDADGKQPMALALSIEGKTRVGQMFSPLTGLTKAFGIIWSLSTWEEYAARTVYHEKLHMIPYPMLLSHQEKQALIKEAMLMAAVDREGEYYHTIKNNCTNNLVILLNKVLPENKKVEMWKIPYMVYNMKATMPQMVIKNLQKQGILGKEFVDINEKTLHTNIE